MKKASKNEIDMISLINKIQDQLNALDKKIDMLLPKPAVDNRLVARSGDHNKGRMMHTAICADCKKECTIPFKPSPDRPVYCQDCFSRRKVIKLSGIKVAPIPVDTPKPPVKKKTVSKKKPTPKKK